MTIKNKRRKLRFMLTGAVSTSIDFGILFLLHAVGFQSVVANFFSTGTAFCFSFFANRHYTFEAHGGDPGRQFVLFFVVTFAGIWGIQPVIIAVAEPMVATLGHPAWINLAVAKLLATGVTLLWNYFLYSRVVFPKNESKPLG